MNTKLRGEIEKILDKHYESNLIILGDFNAHVGFKGRQKLDNNGKMVLEWLEK